MFTADTTTDRSPNDVWRRAAAYTTTTLAIAAEPAEIDDLWRQWSAHAAHVTAVTGPYSGDADSDEPTGRLRAVSTVTVNAVGRDGWAAAPLRYAVRCDLLPVAAGQLRVQQYAVDPLGAG